MASHIISHNNQCPQAFIRLENSDRYIQQEIPIPAMPVIVLIENSQRAQPAQPAQNCN